MNIFIVILGIVLGFLIAKFCSGKNTNDDGKFKLILKTKKHTYRLHHWLVATSLMIILLIFSLHNHLLYGLLIGIVIQGLTYKDWNKIKVK